MHSLNPVLPNVLNQNASEKERSIIVHNRFKFPFCALVVQIAIVLLFAIFVEYPDDANATLLANLDKEKATSLNTANNDSGTKLQYPDANFVNIYGPGFQDSQFFLIMGLTLLFVGLKPTSRSTIAIALFIVIYCLELALLFRGFIRKESPIKPDVKIFVLTVYFSEAALIAWGFVLGRCNQLQLLFMLTVEMAVCCANDYVSADVLKTNDPGGAITYNLFGTYFGIGVTRMLYKPGHDQYEWKRSSSVTNEILTFAGCIILWIFWPTAMGSLFIDGHRHRTIINTYFALIGSAAAGIIFTPLLDPRGKYTSAYLQNAVLAGGVAICGTADSMTGVYVATIVGFLAGTSSILCSVYIEPLLASKFHVIDTCGSHNLHGVPAIVGGIAASITATLATEDIYGSSLYAFYPARAPSNGSSELQRINAIWPDVKAGENRSAALQGLYQLAAVGTTFCISSVSGFLVGYFMQLDIFDPLTGEAFYDDTPVFNKPAGAADEYQKFLRARPGQVDPSYPNYNHNDVQLGYASPPNFCAVRETGLANQGFEPEHEHRTPADIENSTKF